MTGNSDVWTTVLRMPTRTSPWSLPWPVAGCTKSCLGKGWERNLHACFLGLHPSHSMSSSSSSSPKRGVGGGRPFMLWQNRKERSVLIYPCPGGFLPMRGSGPRAVLPLWLERRWTRRTGFVAKELIQTKLGQAGTEGSHLSTETKTNFAWLIL